MKNIMVFSIGTLLVLISCSLDEDITKPQISDIKLVINEFMASNESCFSDENEDFDDWIEIYNFGDEAIDIGGMYFTDDLTDLTKSQIPDTYPDSTTILPGEFLIIWADKEPEQGVLHLDDVKLSGDGEQIGLTDIDGTTIIDSISFDAQTTDVSYGRLPDGSEDWEYFGDGFTSMPSPGSANGSGDEPQAIFVINEFLASNDYCYADPYGDFDDWIEIYNAGNKAGNIAGMYFTDDLTDLTKSQIPDTYPDSTTILPGEFLIIWADKEPEQGVLHLDDVKLSGDGEQIGLTDIDGTTIIDSISFGAQTTDVSYGRLPDGSEDWEYFETPTPGESNQ